MSKLVLMSILVATVALPARAARSRSAVRGLRRAVAWVALFNVAYLIAIAYLLPHLP